jgi:hypothetical protein
MEHVAYVFSTSCPCAQTLSNVCLRQLGAAGAALPECCLLERPLDQYGGSARSDHLQLRAPSRRVSVYLEQGAGVVESACVSCGVLCSGVRVAREVLTTAPASSSATP